MTSSPTFPAARLVELAKQILQSLGVPDVDAELVADSLVTSDMWGHPSQACSGLAGTRPGCGPV